MPFYEYECSACKFYVEALQKVSDPPMKQCPSCKKQTLKKLVSAPVFRLKGGGWYETDFKSDQESKRNLVGEEKESAPEAKADDKSKEKPAESQAESKPADSKAKKPSGKTAVAVSKKKSVGKKPKSKPKPAAKKK